MTPAMIERHITFDVLPGRTDAFEQFFAETYRPAMTTSPGFVGADLLREADRPTHYQMVLRWQDGESAAGWRTSPVHQGLQPELESLHSGMEIVAYVVISD